MLRESLQSSGHQIIDVYACVCVCVHMCMATVRLLRVMQCFVDGQCAGSCAGEMWLLTAVHSPLPFKRSLTKAPEKTPEGMLPACRARAVAAAECLSTATAALPLQRQRQ